MKTQNELIKKQKELIKKLGSVGPFMDGSLSEFKRICGNKNCSCRKDQSKKHPALYLSWKEDKKTKSLYIPVDRWTLAYEYSENYKQFKALVREISELGKEVFRTRPKKEKKS